MNSPSIIQNWFSTKSIGGAGQTGRSAVGKTGAASAFSAILAQIRSVGKTGTDTPPLQPQQSAAPVLSKGHALVAELKKTLQKPGVSLNELKVGDDALAAVEQVLIGAGFEAGQVRNLLGELKAPGRATPSGLDRSC